MTRPSTIFVLLSAFSLSITSAAAAYSTNSVVSDPCHEDLSFRAMRGLRGELPSARPVLTPNADEKALLNDLPYERPDDMRDMDIATIVLANRDVDLRGSPPGDLDSLAEKHGDPANQDEHCLRRPSQDGQEGSIAALEECRAFIREQAIVAIDALGSDGRPDEAARQHVDVFLDIRGVTRVPLNKTYVALGRALHTIQDGISHTFRTDDLKQVVTVLNYTEYAEGDHSEATDGPAHASLLDRCFNVDKYRKQRADVAVEASQVFLRAVLAPAAGRDERIARVDAMLDEYFTHATGCDASNRWCDAREFEYADLPGCGCTAPGKRQPPGGTLWLLAAVMGLALARRGWRGRPAHAAAALAATVVLMSPLRSASAADAATDVNTEKAGADTGDADREPEAAPGTDDGGGQAADAASDSGSDSKPAESEETADTDVKPVVKESRDTEETPGPERATVDLDVSPDSELRPDPFPWGVHVSGAFSLENAAAAATLGGRYRLSAGWLVGLNAEWNPFFSRATGAVRKGVLNVYATLVKRYPMRFDVINLRTTLHVGASRMLFDVFGVPEGTTGPFVGFSLLGLDVELARSVYLIVEPAEVAIPYPQTSGVPFLYPQYRFTLGLQFGA